MLKTVSYKFTRNINDHRVSNERASTDAIGALEQWTANVSSREYEVSDDNDEFIIATVRFSSSDNNARDDMASACRQYSVQREMII